MKNKKIWKDRGGGVGAIMPIAIVLVVLVIGALLVMGMGAGDDGAGGGGGGGGGGDDGDDDTGSGNGKCSCTATCKIYVKDLTTNQVYTGTVSTEGTSFSEAMMLTFGEGIRSTTLQPAQMTNENGGSSPPTSETSALYKSHAYSMWLSVTFKVTGDNMKSIDSAEIEFYGKAGTASSSSTPDHVSGTDALYCSACSNPKVTLTKTGLTDGQVYVLSSADKPFNQVYTSGGKIALDGDRVDGSIVNVYITARGTDTAGGQVTAGAMATLKFSAPAYQSGSMVVTIISLEGHYE
jgi:hypothetical protein